MRLLARACQFRGSCDTLNLLVVAGKQLPIPRISLEWYCRSMVKPSEGPSPSLMDIRSEVLLHCPKRTLVISRLSCHIGLITHLMPLISSPSIVLHPGDFCSHHVLQSNLLTTYRYKPGESELRSLNLLNSQLSPSISVPAPKWKRFMNGVWKRSSGQVGYTWNN